jgi:hypothetical protein
MTRHKTGISLTRFDRLPTGNPDRVAAPHL